LGIDVNHRYNITNVDNVLATGEQLNVKEIGPYRYKRYHRKMNVKFESTNGDSEIRAFRLQNDLCTYSLVYDYQFVGGVAKLNDTITTLNIGYLRVLGELAVFQTTDRYLVAHFAAGLLQEQRMITKARMKILALNKVLAHIPYQRLNRMYADLRISYALRAIESVNDFRVAKKWDMYTFTRLFGANSYELEDPAVAAFQVRIAFTVRVPGLSVR
jgi:hypothetical protein